MVSAMGIFCKWLLPFNYRSIPWATATHHHMLELNISQHQFFFVTNKDKMFLSITYPVGQPLICRESKNASGITGRKFWKVVKWMLHLKWLSVFWIHPWKWCDYGCWHVRNIEIFIICFIFVLYEVLFLLYISNLFNMFIKYLLYRYKYIKSFSILL